VEYLMAPLLVQPVDASRAPLVLATPVAAATVIELKQLLAERLGTPPVAQRLVARGRVLCDEESLEDAGLAAGGRVFLAVASALRTTSAGAVVEDSFGADVAAEPAAAAEPAEAESEASDQPADRAGFEVLVCRVDDGEELRVFARPTAPTTEFKREALHRLRCPTVSAEELERWSFVCGGRLLSSSGPLEEEPGIRPGARVVVVPPRSPAKLQISGCRMCCRRRSCSLSTFIWLLRNSIGILVTLPRKVLSLLAATWNDPWILVRPNGEEHRGRRIQTLRLHPRALVYGPGQNPHGEDLTILFSQGLVGMGG